MNNRRSVFAQCQGQMLLAADSEEELKKLLDRLEGKGVAGVPAVNESMAYGEVYGVVRASMLAELLGETNASLGQLLERSMGQAVIDADVSHDLGLVADIAPNDVGEADELRRALGSALSLGRVKAQASRDERAASVLDLTHVREAEASSGVFRLETGLPNKLIVEVLKECVERRALPPRRDSTDAGVSL